MILKTDQARFDRTVLAIVQACEQALGLAELCKENDPERSGLLARASLYAADLCDMIVADDIRLQWASDTGRDRLVSMRSMAALLPADTANRAQSLLSRNWG